MKADMNKTGLNIFFKPWQTIIVEKILSSDTKWTTKEAYEYVNAKLGDKKISRASVFSFLQKLEREGLLRDAKRVARGGFGMVYWRIMDLTEFWLCMRCQFTDLTDKALLDLSKKASDEDE